MKKTDTESLFLEFALSKTGDAIYLVSSEGKFQYVNDSACRMTEYSKDELLSMGVPDIAPSYPLEKFKEVWDAIKEKKLLIIETIHRRKDGTEIPVEITTNYFEYKGKEYTCSVVRNITIPKESERRLKESEERYRMLAEQSIVGVCIIQDGKFVYVNPHLAKLLDCRPEEMDGVNVLDLVAERHRELVKENMRKRMSGEVPFQHYNFCAMKKGGSEVTIEVYGSILTFKGRPAIMAIVLDITERKRAEEKLQSLSITDELTGIYNRRGFFVLAEQQFNIAKRQKSRIFLLYVDVDNMKFINDVLGHQEGDVALIEIANVLKSTFRDTDIIARIGGDEFVVFPVGTTEEYLDIVTARLQQNLENHNIKKGRTSRLSISVGIASYDPETPCSIDELLAKADTMMYEQKRQKKKS